ncbi:hypothetical protein F4779DRAFT_568536 [Xylariaceae sp. FL0662B]|nr:hypothetical protein F4779DRAFT_568536 [Xylariaceae sp. FL0662B]
MATCRTNQAFVALGSKLYLYYLLPTGLTSIANVQARDTPCKTTASVYIRSEDIENLAFMLGLANPCRACPS